MPTNILTIACTNRPGIVHAVSGFLLACGGNVDETAEFNDHETQLFFMRVQFVSPHSSQTDLRAQLTEFAQQFEMRWQLYAADQPMRTVLMVSKEGHCLNDLLYRWQSG